MNADYLSSSNYFDYNTDAFQSFINLMNLSGTTQNKVIQIHDFIRDYFLYDPYHLVLLPDALVASHIITKKRAWCVEKAVVMVATCRSIGIPARPGYAIVKNHIGMEKLQQHLKKDYIVFHGYVEVFIHNKWVKCTPAFDRRVCRLMGVQPLEFDGIQDSLFQEFEEKGQFMEYIYEYGVFKEVPLDLMRSEMNTHYPHLFEKGNIIEKGFTFIHEPTS